MRLDQSFYLQDVLVVAPQLLGKVLVRRLETGQVIEGLICETESYRGEEDLACHARFGRTKRTQVLYGQAGHVYMYLIYGMYWMLNIVTGAVDQPQAVLVRGVVTITPPSLPPYLVRGRLFVKGEETVAISPSLSKSIILERHSGLVQKPTSRKEGILDGPGKLTRHFHLDKSFYGESLMESERIWIEDRGIVVDQNEIVTTPRIGVEYAGEWAKKEWRYVLTKL